MTRKPETRGSPKYGVGDYRNIKIFLKSNTLFFVFQSLNQILTDMFFDPICKYYLSGKVNCAAYDKEKKNYAHGCEYFLLLLHKTQIIPYVNMSLKFKKKRSFTPSKLLLR